MFVPARKLQRHRRLIVSIDGMPFTGKTHFLCTAPRPLYIFNLDYGLEGVLESLEESGISLTGIHFEDYSLRKPPLTSRIAVDHARTTAKRFYQSFQELLRQTQRLTVGLDTGSEFWRIFRLADLGRLSEVPPMRYVRVNMVFRDMLNEIMSTPHNLVLIHRQKDRYDTKIAMVHGEPKEVSVRVPGKVDRDGFKEMDGMMQVVVQAYRRSRKDGSAIMGFQVVKCRQRLSLVGRRYEGDLATFAHLALDVYPDSNPDEWGMP